MWDFCSFLYISVKTTQSFLMAGSGRSILYLLFAYLMYCYFTENSSTHLAYSSQRVKKTNQLRLSKRKKSWSSIIFFIIGSQQELEMALLSLDFQTLHNVSGWPFRLFSAAAVARNMFYKKFRSSECPHLNKGDVRKDMTSPPISCAALSPLHFKMGEN